MTEQNIRDAFERKVEYKYLDKRMSKDIVRAWAESRKCCFEPLVFIIATKIHHL